MVFSSLYIIFWSVKHTHTHRHTKMTFSSLSIQIYLFYVKFAIFQYIACFAPNLILIQPCLNYVYLLFLTRVFLFLVKARAPYFIFIIFQIIKSSYIPTHFWSFDSHTKKQSLLFLQAMKYLKLSYQNQTCPI